MRTSRKLKINILFILAGFILLYSCRDHKLTKSENITQRIGHDADTNYQFSAYIKKDSAGNVQVVGQLLNGKKDGAWRFYHNKKLAWTEYYDQDHRILVSKPEERNTFATYQVYLPDSLSKIFSYSKNKLSKIETIHYSQSVQEQFDYQKNTDTLIINNKINDSVFFNTLTNRKNSFYQMAFAVNDSSVLLIDLVSGKFYVK